MARGKPLDAHARGQVVGAWKTSKSQRQISALLNIPHTTVQRIIKHFEEYGHNRDKPRSGRPKKIDYRLERRILQVVYIIPDIPYRELKKRTGTEHLSKSTIYRLLRKHNLTKW